MVLQNYKFLENQWLETEWTSLAVFDWDSTKNIVKLIKPYFNGCLVKCGGAGRTIDYDEDVPLQPRIVIAGQCRIVPVPIQIIFQIGMRVILIDAPMTPEMSYEKISKQYGPVADIAEAFLYHSKIVKTDNNSD